LERDDNSLIKDYFISGLEPPLTNGSELDVMLEILPTENGLPKLKFCAKRPILYKILRSDGQSLQILSTYQYQSGEIIFEDTTALIGKIYEYYVVASMGEKSQESNKIKLLVT
jgi:hypothetical protein